MIPPHAPWRVMLFVPVWNYSAPFYADFQLQFQNHQLITIILVNRRLLDPRSPGPEYPPRPPPANRSRERLAVDIHDAETKSGLASDSPMIYTEKQREKGQKQKKKNKVVKRQWLYRQTSFSRTLFGHAVVAMLVRFWRSHNSPQHKFTTRFGCYCLRE